MSKIKFIVIGHKDFDEYLDFFCEGFSDKKDDIIFLFDSKIDSKISERLENDGYEFYSNDVNIGKLNTLVKYKDKFDSSFIKIIDSDDSFVFDELDSIKEQISKINYDCLLIHNGTVLTKESEFYGIQSTDESVVRKQLELSKELNWDLPPNAKCIYPVSSLYKIEKSNIERQDYFNDDLLTLATLVLNENKINYINSKFYIQFQALGQTSKTKIKRIENYLLLYKNLNRIIMSNINGGNFVIAREYKQSLDLFDLWVSRLEEKIEEDYLTKLKEDFISQINTLYKNSEPNYLRLRNLNILDFDGLKCFVDFLIKNINSVIILDDNIHIDDLFFVKNVIKHLTGSRVIFENEECSFCQVNDGIDFGTENSREIKNINFNKILRESSEIESSAENFIESYDIKFDPKRYFLMWDISNEEELEKAKISINSVVNNTNSKKLNIFITYEFSIKESILSFIETIKDKDIKINLKFVRENYFLSKDISSFEKQKYYWISNDRSFAESDLAIRFDNFTIIDFDIENLFIENQTKFLGWRPLGLIDVETKDIFDSKILMYKPLAVQEHFLKKINDKKNSEISSESSLRSEMIGRLEFEKISYEITGLNSFSLDNTDENVLNETNVWNIYSLRRSKEEDRFTLRSAQTRIYDDLLLEKFGSISNSKEINARYILETLISNYEKIDFNLNKITLLLTVFNSEKKDIDYWKLIYFKFKELGGKLQILIDSPGIEEQFDWVHEDDLFVNNENIGKFLTVYNHIKNDFVKTEYFKTFDPDDRISIFNFVNFKLPKKTSIIRMINVRSDGDLPSKQDEVEILFGSCKKMRLDNFGTSWTILPTKSIYIDNYFDGSRIDINEDQILGQISYSNNYPVFNSEESFYLYKSEGGVSSLEKFPKYLSYLPNTLRVSEMLKSKSGKTPPTNWPGEFVYYNSLKRRFEEKFRFLNSSETEIWESIQKFKSNPLDELDPESTYDVCMISDINQFDYALSSMLNTSLRTKFKINYHLIVDDVIPEYIEKLNRVNNYLRKINNSKIEIVNASDFPIEKFESKLSHITWVTNLRIFLTTLLPNVKGHVLYLDNDTYVDGDISEAFRFVKNKRGHFGQSWNSEQPWPIKLAEIANKTLSSYYNAGVLLLDCDLLREMDFENSAIEFYTKNKDVIRYADQDILNSTLQIRDFPSNFNIGRDNWPIQLDELNNIYKLKIYHFLSYSKPWDNNEYNLEKINDINVAGTITIEEYSKFMEPRQKWITEYEFYEKIIK